MRSAETRGELSIRCGRKTFSIGDDFWIENNRGERAFTVDGKTLRVRDTLII